MREADLSPPVSKWLEYRGFEVYSEVPIDYWTADLVGVKEHSGGRHVVVVELKAGLTELVAYQAHRSIPFANEVWVAVGTQPAKRGRGWKTCERWEIGVLSLKTGVAEMVRRSRFFEPYRELNLRNLTPGGLGGLTNRERTPAQDVKKAVLAYVTDHPEATWAEIYKAVPNHYAQHRSLRQHHNTDAVKRARKTAL